MRDKAVDDCLAALKFVPDSFVTSKMIKIFFTALYADENILYFNVFICNGMGTLYIDLNNINLDDANYDKNGPDTITLIRLLALHIKFEKHKELKKMISEELIPIAWHSSRSRNFCVPEDEKKEIESIFTEQCF